MLSTLFQKFSQSLDLLFPPKCVHCDAANNSWLCSSCYNNIFFINSSVCNHCGTPIDDNKKNICKQCHNNPLQYIDGIRVASYFEDNPIRSAIHALKYRNRKVVATILGEILANTYQQYQLNAEVIVPVPLHRSRSKERGYNQSELVAKHLGRLLNKPLNVTSLQRIKKTTSQMTLGAVERHKNVAGAFSCIDNQLQDKKVLVIDDVCTTGSTLDFCAVALKESGATSVWGLTLAKAK